MTNTYYIGEPIGPMFPEDAAPIFGYKVIMVRWDDGKPVIIPPHFHTNETKFADESYCRKNHKDEVSFQKCSCGFYSYHTSAEATNHLNGFNNSANCFIAQSALSGIVIEAEKGMKSTKQRVRQILVSPCWSCSAQADAFVEHESGYLVSACESCIEKASLVKISFGEFQAATQVENFNPISVVPLEKVSREAVDKAFDNVDAKAKIYSGLRELLKANNVEALINMKFQLDELISSKL